MQAFKWLLAIITTSIATLVVNAQTTYYYDGTGALNNTSNWWTLTNGTGANPSNFTGNNLIFRIINTTSVSLSSNWNVTGTGSRVELGASDRPAITFRQTGGDFNGNFAINASSSGSNTYNIQVATGRIPTLTNLHSTSTVIYNFTNNIVVQGTTFGNLRISNSSGQETAGGNITVNGVLTIDAGCTLNLSTFSLFGNFTTSGTGTIRVQNTSPTPIPSNKSWSFTVNYNSNSAQTIVAGNYANLSSSNAPRLLSGNLNISGVFTTGSGTYTTAGSSVTYNGTGTTQTIPVIPYNNLTIAGSGNKTFAANTTINGILNISSGTLTIGGGLTLTLNGSITGSGTLTCGTCGNTSLPNLIIGGSGTFGTINLTLNARTLGNTTINRTAGTVSFGTPVNFAGTLTLTNGALVIDNRIAFHTSNTPISRTNGTITLGTNSVLIFGNCDQSGSAFTLPNNLFTTAPIITELWVDRTNGITLNNQMLRVISVLTLTNNAKLTTNGNITLVSNASSTARLAPITGSSSITGNMVVERFIPASARRWRFMSSCMSNATLADWKNEIFVTGAGTGTTVGQLNSNGFDATATNSPSIYYYNETAAGNANNGWTAQTNNTSSLSNVSLVAGRGYRIFIRGDRSSLNRLTDIDLSQNAVTLNLIGTVNTGNVTMPITYTNSGDAANDGWNLIGNPYPSPYDWNAFWDAGNTGGDDGTYYTNVGQTISIFDASTNSYRSFNSLSNGGTFNGIVAQGQAFFVKSTGSGTNMTFVESFKSSGTPTQLFKSEPSNELKISLFADSINTDELIVKYINGATLGFDAYDIEKRVNPKANISSLVTNSNWLTLDAREQSSENDTVKVIVGSSAGSYKIIIGKLPNNGKQYILIDNYLNYTMVLTDTSIYNFDITNNTATFASNRFIIVSQELGALPVSILTLSGNKMDRSNLIKVNTFNEINVERISLMRSNNGIDFIEIGSTQAKGGKDLNTTYKFTDTKPSPINYYRVLAIDFDGRITTSKILHLGLEVMNNNDMTCYPNTADEYIIVNSEKLESEILFRCEFYNALGNLVLTKLEYANQNNFRVDTKELTNGFYHLVVRNGEHVIGVKKIHINHQ